jgi:hypothetical protein
MGRDDLQVEVNFESWDGDGTVTVSNKSGVITLDVRTAREQLQNAIDEIERRQADLGWNR